MPTDPFSLLRAIAGQPEAFTEARAQADAAVASIFAAAAKASDKARIAMICDAIGADEFDALAKKLRAADVKAIVDRIEGPAAPARTAAAALAGLSRIARGVAAPRVFDLANLDLAGLREAHAALGAGFEAWLSKQGAKIKPAMQKLDPHFPKLATITPAKARSRLTELARGVEPKTAEPAFRLADLDLNGLRRARTELGEHFKSWIDAQKPAELKAALVRIDKLRPNVKKLPKEHYPFLLGEIADGGSLFTKDEDAPPIGQEVFSMRKG